MRYEGPTLDIGPNAETDGDPVPAIVQQGARTGRTIYVQATGDTAPTTVPGDIVLAEGASGGGAIGGSLYSAKGILTTRHDLTNNSSRVQHLSSSGWDYDSVANTVSCAPGSLTMALSEVKAGTPSNLVMTYSSATASDTFYLVLYNVDGNGYPTTVAYSWGPLTMAGASGAATLTGQTTAIEAGLYYEGVFCPTGNAGSAVFHGLRSTLLHPMASSGLLARAFGIVSGDTAWSTPGDVSAFTFGSSSTATRFGYVNGPTPVIKTYGNLT